MKRDLNICSNKNASGHQCTYPWADTNVKCHHLKKILVTFESRIVLETIVQYEGKLSRVQQLMTLAIWNEKKTTRANIDWINNLKACMGNMGKHTIKEQTNLIIKITTNQCIYKLG